MRCVRCEVCGTKALMAASQCPKCSHLFEMRDGFGELLPLAFCSSCQSYYPAHVGMCKWCGTTPEPVRKIEVPWARIALGGLVAMSLGGLLLRDPIKKPSSRARATAQSRQKKDIVPDSASMVVAMAPVDTYVTPNAVPSAGGVVTPETSTPQVPTATAPEPVLQATQRNARRATRTLGPPGLFDDLPTPAAAAPVASPTARTKTPASRWESAVARSWVVVRSAARKDARIVASVGPESRVQLGESQGGWRRIRSRDIAGWIDLRHASFGAVRGSRTSGFASR